MIMAYSSDTMMMTNDAIVVNFGQFLKSFHVTDGNQHWISKEAKENIFPAHLVDMHLDNISLFRIKK